MTNIAVGKGRWKIMFLDWTDSFFKNVLGNDNQNNESENSTPTLEFDNLISQPRKVDPNTAPGGITGCTWHNEYINGQRYRVEEKYNRDGTLAYRSVYKC